MMREGMLSNQLVPRHRQHSLRHTLLELWLAVLEKFLCKMVSSRLPILQLAKGKVSNQEARPEPGSADNIGWKGRAYLSFGDCDIPSSPYSRIVDA